MAKTLNEVIAALPARERREIETRAQDLIAEEMSLQDLRKAIGKTQAAVAKRLKVGQDAISKIETRSDMYISTLRGFVKAMGGELELVALFPGRPPVRLEELGAHMERRASRRPRSKMSPGQSNAAVTKVRASTSLSMRKLATGTKTIPHPKRTHDPDQT